MGSIRVRAFLLAVVLIGTGCTHDENICLTGCSPELDVSADNLVPISIEGPVEVTLCDRTVCRTAVVYRNACAETATAFNPCWHHGVLRVVLYSGYSHYDPFDAGLDNPVRLTVSDLNGVVLFDEEAVPESYVIPSCVSFECPGRRVRFAAP